MCVCVWHVLRFVHLPWHRIDAVYSFNILILLVATMRSELLSA